MDIPAELVERRKRIGEKKKSERSLPKCSRSRELGAGCRMTGPAS